MASRTLAYLKGCRSTSVPNAHAQRAGMYVHFFFGAAQRAHGPLPIRSGEGFANPVKAVVRSYLAYPVHCHLRRRVN